MRIVAVIDIREGRAVHAIGGRRTEYAPVARAAGMQVNGDAGALAVAYVGELGARELYVADLDAIEGGVAGANEGAIAAVAAAGVPVWLDVGASSVESARAALGLGASTVVIGLETLTSFGALEEICAGVGSRRVAFSIDLRGRQPIGLPNASHAALSPHAIAERAADAGVGSIIVLDLARVGTSAGIDIALMRELRRAVPSVALFAGGGVRSQWDLDQLRAAGCDGALVATALLNGAVRGAGDQSRTRNVAD
jgi:phosphoribosylformimino-5-aminoimidazole carboxamide ribotide isomerase